MAVINSINNKSGSFTINNTLNQSDNAFIQYGINGSTKFTLGSYAAVSDYPLTISSGSDLGTNDCFKILNDIPSGVILKPLQPAICVGLDASTSNITGDGTVVTVTWDDEQVDRNNDFNGSTTFTAPITGKYFFSANLRLSTITGSHDYGYIEFTATSGSYRASLINPYVANVGNVNNLKIEVVIPMTASDTLVVKTMVSGSTKSVNSYGNAASSGRISNYLTGYLIC